MVAQDRIDCAIATGSTRALWRAHHPPMLSVAQDRRRPARSSSGQRRQGDSEIARCLSNNQLHVQLREAPRHCRRPSAKMGLTTANVAITARDSDVIQTLAWVGLGVGIIAHAASIGRGQGPQGDRDRTHYPRSHHLDRISPRHAVAQIHVRIRAAARATPRSPPPGPGASSEYGRRSRANV